MLFVANWKMNPPSLKEAQRLLRNIKAQLRDLPPKNSHQIVICPPAIFLAKINQPTTRLRFGVQNIGWQERGAFTGETSVLMAADAGAEYCIIGHSERRTMFGEDDALANGKIKLCLEKNITPIYCIGETLAEKKQGKTRATLQKQLREGLKGVNIASMKKVMITYEPSWVISTQKNSEPETPDNVLSITILIRKIIRTLYDKKTAQNLPILYGGSVNPQNVGGYVQNKSVEGFLIGSAGLNAYSFGQILKKSLE